MKWREAGGLLLLIALTVFLPPHARANKPLHRDILVFVPAYEASFLDDPALTDPGDPPVCVWGSLDAIRSKKLYLALRMPNPLLPRPMISAGLLNIYATFYEALTHERDSVPEFRPYTLGADFFVFSYDWRQEIGTVLAPALGRALTKYAEAHERLTGVPASQVRFTIVTHSMGGLVARTLLRAQPAWCARLEALDLVGIPNLGSVKAIQTLITGPGGLKENALTFPISLLNLLPDSVDANLTKLVAITRPSLYELLPEGNPNWTVIVREKTRTITAPEVFTVAPWRDYWPSAELERRLFLNSWLKDRLAAGYLKDIPKGAWAFCQDPTLAPLQRLLDTTRRWRAQMGTLRQTAALLESSSGSHRLHVVLGSGLSTPTGLISTGSHDNSSARLTYAAPDDGDETVTVASGLDDLPRNSPEVLLLPKASHGRLMNDSRFLDQFCRQLATTPP